MVDMNFSSGTTRTQRLGPVGSIVFALIGLLMLAGAVYFGVKTGDLMAHGLHTQGQVVDVVQKMETETHHNGGYTTTSRHMMYYPVVKFDDANKKSFQFKSHSGSSNPNAHTTGQAVPVIYLADDPQGSAIIDEGAMNWLMPGVLGFMGVIFTLLGGFSFLRALMV